MESVSNALRVLNLLAGRSELGVSEVSEELKVARSTAHRLLTTLCRHGFAVRSSGRRYVVGTQLNWLYWQADVTGEVARCARPLLQEIAGATGETTNLLGPAGADVIFLDGWLGGRAISLSSRVGDRVPALFTASGRALLAQMPAAVTEAVYAEIEKGSDGHRLPALSAIHDELEQTRKRGHAIFHDDDLASVGVPIFGRTGQPVAAMTVVTPPGRMTGERSAELAELLKDAVARIDLS